MRIDSGLGWLCSEEFFRTDAGVIFRLSDTRFSSKSNDGGCVAVVVKFNSGASSGYYSGILMSTERNNVLQSVVGGMNISSNGNADIIDATTWYFSNCWYDRSNVWENMDVPYIGNVPETSWTSIVLAAANVRVLRDEKKVIEKVYRKTNGVWTEIEPVEV